MKRAAFALGLGMSLLAAGCGGGAGAPEPGSASATLAQEGASVATTGAAPAASTPPAATATPAPGTTTTTTSPTTTVTANGSATGGTALAPIGVNIEGLSDWARLQPFVDLMKSSRHWGSFNLPWDEAAPVDALGWPVGDAAVVVNVRTYDTGDDQKAYRYVAPGTYRLQFTGKATVGLSASPGVQVANSAYDSATNRSVADVVVGSGATQVMLTFANTAGGVRDVTLRSTQYPSTQTFTDEFVKALAPFRVVRLMNFLATNNNPVRSWSERTTPSAARQAGPKGAAFEFGIQLANELGKDIWINVPVGADESYVRSLATLLKQTLAPGRNVYVEYSNELWNFQFTQATANVKAAVAEAIAGDTTLTKGTTCTQAMFDAATGSCNPYWAGYYRVGKQTVRIAQIFSEVWGAAAMNQQVRVVYATQFANPGIAEQVLKNIATYRATPSTLLYGIATAPYFYLPADLAASQSATPDQILQGLQASLDTKNLPYFKVGATGQGGFVPGQAYDGGNYTGATHKALADYYGLKSLAYEGGPDLGQSAANTAAKIAANRDPRMGAMLAGELSQWLGCGNDLFMVFAVSSPWDQYGYWGLTNDPTDLTGSKYTTVSSMARSDRSTFTSCR